MTLVNRVSAFFLLAMAAVLAGFSALLYVLVERSMVQQFDQELRGAMSTLMAAIDDRPDHFHWNKSDHTVAIGAESGSDEIRWVIFDQDRKRVDGSINLTPPDVEDLLDAAQSEWEDAMETGPESLVHVRLNDGDREYLTASRTAGASSTDPRPASDPSKLVVAVRRSRESLRRDLHQLALLVTGLSIGAFLLAAIGGRWYCLKALHPVRIMVERARSATEADFRLRLPVTDHKDELAELAVAFNSLLDQLQTAFEKQQRFTGDAAHQLRTPLTVLQGQIDVAMRRSRTPEEYQRTLGLLREQSVEMHQAVEGLLYLARAEGEGHPPVFEPGDVTPWLNRQLDRWSTHYRRQDLTLEHPIELRLSTSWALLGQLLHNLIDNAFKYSSPGTPVTVRAERDGNDLLLSVSDKGIGISREEQTVIFQPFFRSPSARRSGAPGVGLGLPIAARIAESLHGRIQVESATGQGSMFRLRFPLQIDSLGATKPIPTQTNQVAASV
jgi:signal transduction histidine kinase